MEFDQHFDAILGNPEVEERLPDPTERISPLQAHIDQPSALTSLGIIDESDTLLEPSKKTITIVPADARVNELLEDFRQTLPEGPGFREQQQCQDILGSSQMPYGSERQQQGPGRRKRCRKKFPGKQFPHYCSECDVSFKASCIGIHHMLVPSTQNFETLVFPGSKLAGQPYQIDSHR
jgi:hypothetical protein